MNNLLIQVIIINRLYLNSLFGFFVGNYPEIQRANKNGKIMHDLFVEW